MQGSKFVHTIRKAAKSLQACTTAVTTTKEAKALHGVGDSLARIIVLKHKEVCIIPLSRASSITSTTSVSASITAESITTGPTSTITNKLKRKTPPNATLVPDRKVDASYRLSGKHKAYLTAVKEAESLQLPADDWRVILIVDGREHGWEKVLAKLQMSGIPSEKRNLPIGDMAWIARSGSIEIMLGTIIERKEVHDLASSLFGTRYLEQRLRLQHCGLPQVFLLVEGDTKSVNNCPHENLQMAMMETRVQLDFQVIQTKHLEDTVRFLKCAHRRILQRAFPSAFYWR
jgi:crossover junction endonuclease MUS81